MAALVLCGAAIEFVGGVAAARQFHPATFLLSRSESGGLPNGASCCGVVSHDERVGRVMAFESLASDIAPGARLGIANVYAVFRRPPWAAIGSTWVPARTVLVSRGLGGRPANGPSWAPALSGDSANVPRCVAFLSRASNLVPGDHGRVAQAFLEDLVSRRIERVSVNSAGVRADRAATEVAVSGDCRRVAFVSAATNLAQVGSAARWRGARTRRPRRGTSQVYVRFLAGSGSLTGLTMLASAHGIRPANSDASGVSISRNGDALAFASAASDLGSASRGVVQVWERALSAPNSPARLRAGIRLLSRAGDGGGGDRPSGRPSVDHDGAVVAFESLATNLLPGATGVSQIMRAAITGRGVRLDWVSKAWARPEPGNGPSHDASITDGGEWVFFDSTAGNLGPPGYTGPPGPRQVYNWTVPALTTAQDQTHVEEDSLGGPFQHVAARTPSAHPDTSARGNYVPFESDDPGLDPALADHPEPAWYPGGAPQFTDWYPFRVLPGVREGALTPLLPGVYGTPDRTAGDRAVDPRLHQAYVRFLGSNG